MKKHYFFLTGLQVAVGVASLILSAQPSLSLELITLVSKSTQSSLTGELQDAETYNNQGVELAEHGQFAQAIAAFNRAIQIYPTYENAHNNLGLVLGSQNKFSEAAAAFNRALEINPQNFETYNNLGIALGSQGKFSEAVAAFNQAIQINPDEPTSYQNLGVAFWSQGKLPEAITSLQAAKKLFLVQNNSEAVTHIDQILQQIKSLPEQSSQ